MTEGPIPLTREHLHFANLQWIPEPYLFMEFEGKILIGKPAGYNRVLIDVVEKEDLGEYIAAQWHQRYAEFMERREKEEVEQEVYRSKARKRSLRHDIPEIDLEDLDLSNLGDIEIDL